MTPAQIDMYMGEEARVEAEEEAANGNNTRIDRNTGHKIVRCDTPEEAAALAERICRAKPQS